MTKPLHPEQDELETAIEEIERGESDRPSVEVVIREQKSSFPRVPNTRLAQAVAGLIAIAAIVKVILEILTL